MWLISPPNFATSLTKELLRKLKFVFVDKNIVSTETLIELEVDMGW